MIKMFAWANRGVASCTQSLAVLFVLSAAFAQLALHPLQAFLKESINE